MFKIFDIFVCAGESVAKAAPTWDKKCKKQNGECLIGWKTDCGSDIVYDLCGSGGHQCCIGSTNTAGKEALSTMKLL